MSTLVVSPAEASCICDGCNRLNKRWRSRPTASPEEYEAILSEGMRHLTFDQIQREQELLHGVADEDELPENTINERLSALREHLNQAKKGTDYEKAEQRNQAYACNRDLQMAFLRSTRFDPRESAEKIINFFRYKQDLFGDACLVRDITIGDLEEDDLKCLMEGDEQRSPIRDRSGRKICLLFPGIRTKTALRTFLRARFYLWGNSVATMIDISRGCVLINYAVKQFRDHLNGHGFIESFNLWKNGMPVNVAGIHVCTDSRLEQMAVTTIFASQPYQMRVKSRVHFGSHTECQYLLSSYGIPKVAFPLKGVKNEVDLSHHYAWFAQRRIQEQQQQTAKDYALLQNSNKMHSNRNENDILCMGRAVKNVGNERLLSLVHRYFPAYTNGSKKDRLTIVSLIIDEIHSRGGRFLKLDPNSVNTEPISLSDEAEYNWKELSPEDRRSKVTQTFRNIRHQSSRSNSAPGAAFPSPAAPLSVESVQPEDVLFGNVIMNNPGNRLLRELVLGVAEEYNRTERGKKKDIVLGLIATIHKRGGRFLMVRADQSCELLSDDTARQKISKQFRNLRRRK